MARSDRDEKERNRLREAIRAKYNQRITIAKNGREMFLAKDYTGAAKKYNEYLGILTEIQEVEDIYSITPAKFDPKADVTEMLLISHVYWELSRVYEMTPKLQVAFDKCLKQFVRFTVNQPYQVLNSEVLRKYIKKNKHVSRQILALEKAYSQIQVQSKKCFVATVSLGPDHQATEALRLFKKRRLKGKLASRFVAFYYKFSHPLVEWLETRPLMKRGFAKITKAPLILMAKAASKYSK